MFSRNNPIVFSCSNEAVLTSRLYFHEILWGFSSWHFNDRFHEVMWSFLKRCRFCIYFHEIFYVKSQRTWLQLCSQPLLSAKIFVAAQTAASSSLRRRLLSTDDETETLLLPLKPHRMELIWASMTKNTISRMFFLKNILHFFFLQNFAQNCFRKAYHRIFLRKSQKNWKSAKCVK